MKIFEKNRFVLAAMAALGIPAEDRRSGVSRGRCMTYDTVSNAFTFRMGAGFAGDVSRTHPQPLIDANLSDPTNPPTFFGQAVIEDITSANAVRVPASGDSGLTKIAGITVRPFPFQQASGGMSASFGGEAPLVPPSIIDVLRSGFMMVTLQGTQTVYKGTAVKVCIVAGTGYVVGGFSADSVSGTFITLDARTTFNGPPDANGLVEIAFNI